MKATAGNQKPGGGVSTNGTRQAAGGSRFCPRCESSLTVETDGNGRLRDVCTNTSCGRKFARDPGAAPPRVAEKCRVDGCPGTRDPDGACACCTKRNAWMLANTPKKECQVCDGNITGQRGKTCAACKPIAQKVAVQKAKKG